MKITILTNSDFFALKIPTFGYLPHGRLTGGESELRVALAELDGELVQHGLQVVAAVLGRLHLAEQLPQGCRQELVPVVLQVHHQRHHVPAVTARGEP